MLLSSDVQIHRHPVVCQVTIKGSEKTQLEKKNTMLKRKTSATKVAHHPWLDNTVYWEQYVCNKTCILLSDLFNFLRSEMLITDKNSISTEMQIHKKIIFLHSRQAITWESNENVWLLFKWFFCKYPVAGFKFFSIYQALYTNRLEWKTKTWPLKTSWFFLTGSLHCCH